MWAHACNLSRHLTAWTTTAASCLPWLTNGSSKRSQPRAVRIKNVRTEHTTTLGKDHIYEYLSNPDQSRAGIKHGFLTLKVQIFLKADGFSMTPTARPGESVEPPPVEIAEKWVSLSYPTRSGITAQLSAAGYEVKWVWDTRLADLALQGWEVVIQRDEQGVFTKFRFDPVGPHQTLVKKKN